ncbi:endonuclease/exonuclease/phosphatase family protein [Vaginella massiliensis]|uniref:endonuclease/exonuclease/phosphatase family protein n=1 Tax=Vaginella massiliensis TaxID=1816680 RepID=UPI0008392423|nr:endonuclease/exonuclease/phosphatase family protein [Vaginella massiliensis]
MKIQIPSKTKIFRFLALFNFLVYLSGKAFYNYWIFDILAQYSVYTLLLCVMFALCYSYQVRHRTQKSLVYPIMIIFSLYTLYQHLSPFYFGANDKAEEPNFKIGSINIFSQNHKVEEFKNYLEKENFDVILIQELTPAWQKAIDFVRTHYPYHHEEVRENNFGIGLYSKIPLDTIEVKHYIDDQHPSLLATVRVNQKAVQILGVHPVPPIPNQQRFLKRNLQFELMRKEIDQLNADYVIFLGDFNCTVFSPNFEVLKSDRLKDARSGYGLQNSWNAYIPFFRTNIDHIWVSKNIKVTNFYRGDFIESDHFPIIAELKIE